MSVVQALPSSQLKGMPTQRPESSHLSFMVHGFPSSQPLPGRHAVKAWFVEATASSSPPSLAVHASRIEPTTTNTTHAETCFIGSLYLLFELV
jgi:hypothetical protein